MKATLFINDDIRVKGEVSDFKVKTTHVKDWSDNIVATYSETTVTITATVDIGTEHLLADLLRSEHDKQEPDNE